MKKKEVAKLIRAVAGGRGTVDFQCDGRASFLYSGGAVCVVRVALYAFAIVAPSFLRLMVASCKFKSWHLLCILPICSLSVKIDRHFFRIFNEAIHYILHEYYTSTIKF